MNDCDWDPARVYRSAIRKARKPHVCCECGGTIAVGERHEYVTANWEGTWCDFRTCPDCVVIRCNLARREGSCGGWLHGGMLEELESIKYDPDGERLFAAYNLSTKHRGGTPLYRIEEDA